MRCSKVLSMSHARIFVNSHRIYIALQHARCPWALSLRICSDGKTARLIIGAREDKREHTWGEKRKSKERERKKERQIGKEWKRKGCAAVLIYIAFHITLEVFILIMVDFGNKQSIHSFENVLRIFPSYFSLAYVILDKRRINKISICKPSSSVCVELEKVLVLDKNMYPCTRRWCDHNLLIICDKECLSTKLSIAIAVVHEPGYT